jgi:hypothetical protein
MPKQINILTARRIQKTASVNKRFIKPGAETSIPDKIAQKPTNPVTKKVHLIRTKSKLNPLREQIYS